MPERRGLIKVKPVLIAPANGLKLDVRKERKEKSGREGIMDSQWSWPAGKRAFEGGIPNGFPLPLAPFPYLANWT